MDFTRISAKLKRLLFGSTPSPERLAWEEPLRAELFRKIAWGCAAALIVQSVFLLYLGINLKQFLWTTFEPAGFILLAVWCARKNRIVAATVFLLIGLSHAATFTQMYYRSATLLGAPLVMTILVSGLLVGAYFVRVWSVICCVIVFFVIGVREGDFGVLWETILAWCAVFLVAAWLVELFSRHLERLLETSQLAEERQRSAIVSERTRFARDIHDTLAQGFTGIMMQLNAAEKGMAEGSDSTLDHLEKARKLAQQSLDEARRSVTALRSTSTVSGNLLDTIKNAGRRITADSGMRLEAKLEGTPYAITEQTEAHLLGIAREALTNAVRHSHADRIFLRLSYRTGSVEMSIRDNGHGIIKENPPGFGIRGMKERAEEIGGQLSVSSHPEGGTRVFVRIPNG